MEKAAYFALPMPVRHAESVSTAEREMAETQLSRSNRTSAAESSADREE